MKNANKVVGFSQEQVDHLMRSFDEDTENLVRLSSPLSSLNLGSSEIDEN